MWAALRRALLTVAGTGLQLSSHGARALELIPPVRSAPRQFELSGQWKVQTGTKWDEGAGTEQNRAAACQTVASAPGPTGKRQEHLDAIVSFAGASQRRRLFRELDNLTIMWATGDLPEECRFLLNTQLMFLKKEKDPTSKQFDDDEWKRSLTQAKEVTIDIPEDRVTYEQQEADPRKVQPIQIGEFF